MKIDIRKATEDDLLSIIDLYAQPEIDNGDVISVNEAKELFKKIASYPNYHIYVASLENKIVGACALLIMDNLAHKGSSSAVIEDVAVDPDYQGKGIGKQMMNFVKNICKEEGCYKLSLSSNLKRMNTHKFYGSLGFRQHGISFVIE